MWFTRKPKKHSVEVDEILLDASNLPSFNQKRLEGRLELPLTKRNVYSVGVLFLLIALGFLYQLINLQIVRGEELSSISENNRFDEMPIIGERGVIYDRNGELIAWNENDETDAYEFPMRAYADHLGLGQVIGYISYPQKDAHGFYYRTEYVGRNGVEGAYNDILQGKNGKQIVEEDAHGNILAEHAITAPVPGNELHLSIDAELSQAMYDIIATSTVQAGFRSGAGAIMNVHTGEIIALTSFPSYDPEVMADGDDVALIKAWNENEQFPFLNKVVSGAYTPGSIVKPFVAYAALQENVIDPEKIIVSHGEIVVPNRYNPENPSIFRDWRAHGKMTMEEAIAFSSNVYFYTIGGGFGDQPGLGITKLHEYFTLFGLGSTTGIKLAKEQAGVVPDPAWKQETFDDDWRLGDTYFTAIGQYGFLTTPLQMLRAYAALANGGTLLTPHLVKHQVSEGIDIDLDQNDLDVIYRGMRKTVNYPGGTARALERNDVAIAAKSGTAEVGSGNAYVNSWAAGFWPYEDPQYAFILMMDRAPRSNALGATRIMGDVVEWISVHRPGYLGIKEEDS